MSNETNTTSDLTALQTEAHTIDDSLSRFVKVEKELQTGTDGGGAMTTYLEAGKPRLLIATILLSGKRITKRFYYKDAQVFHTVETSEEFARNANGEIIPGKYQPQRQNGYFLSGGRIVGTSGDPGATLHTGADAGKEVMDESTAFAHAAESPQKSVDVTAFLKTGS